MYKLIARNKRNSIFFLLGFIALFGALCFIVSLVLGDITYGFYGMAVIIAYVIFQYYMSKKLAIKMTNAFPIEFKDNKALYRLVENMAITIGIPTPAIYIIDDPAPNAFAAGNSPKEALIGVTTGLLGMMNKQELEGVLAHEMGHIKNYDTRFSTIIFAMVAIVGLIVDICLRMLWTGGGSKNNVPLLLIALGVLIIFAPLAHFLQAAAGREREYLADASSAEITRYPEGLASALTKIGNFGGSGLRKAPSSMSHLFLNTPQKKKSNWLDKMFATHPPIEERVRRLTYMENH
jgi:heat shock protein HtpX